MALVMSLYNRTVSLTRTLSAGYYNEDEEYVDGNTSLVSIKCNIQPYKQGKDSVNSHTGLSSTNTIKVFTESTLQVADDIDNTIGDQLTYKGKVYYCKELEEWDDQDVAGLSLIPQHSIGFFCRKDKT